jgi:hypothetical protein
MNNLPYSDVRHDRQRIGSGTAALFHALHCIGARLQRAEDGSCDQSREQDATSGDGKAGKFFHYKVAGEEAVQLEVKALRLSQQPELVYINPINFGQAWVWTSRYTSV